MVLIFNFQFGIFNHRRGRQHLDRRLAVYRAQVDLYAESWEELTGEPVKERVLYLTARDRTESW